MGEFELIDRFFASLGASRPDTVLGVGDDAAVLAVPPGHELVTCVDTLVEGRHFPTDCDAYDIGWRSLAVNLSDLAAMGATPAWAMLALTLPEFDEAWLDGFARGLGKLVLRCIRDGCGGRGLIGVHWSESFCILSRGLPSVRAYAVWPVPAWTSRMGWRRTSVESRPRRAWVH